MLGAIEYKDSPIYAHGSYNIWVLRLVSSLIDLSRVVYPLFDIQFDCGLFARWYIPITSNLSAILVKPVGFGREVLWDVDICDLNVVLRAIRGVRAKEKTVDCMILPGISEFESIT